MENWVTARAACSLGGVYSSLLAGAQKDVETRNSQLKGRASYAFKVFVHDGSFAVGVESSFKTTAVRFVLKEKEQRILIQTDNGKIDWSATPTLNDEGECRLLIDGLELEEWQVRKRALEGLLFATPDED